MIHMPFQSFQDIPEPISDYIQYDRRIGVINKGTTSKIGSIILTKNIRWSGLMIINPNTFLLFYITEL